MKQRVHLITLGVKDIEKSAKFYDTIGWQRAENCPPSLVAYDLYGATLGLYSLDALHEDLGIKTETGSGSMTLSYNVRQKNDVAIMLKKVKQAGASILKEPYDIFWGGHIAYFKDPDDHIWEIAYNPFSELGDNVQFCWNGFQK